MDLIEDISQEIDKCIECNSCMEEEICPSYTVRKEHVYSPLGRLHSLNLLIKDEGDEKEIEKSLLTCNGCGRCTEVCPVDIRIGETVTKGRNILYKKGILPKESHKRIIDSILYKDNAVGREEKQKIIYKDPFYDELFDKESDTLLFLGCISSFFHADAVKASIKMLDYLGVSFRLLKEEGCCGIFLYDGGYFDKARDIFRKNRDRFVRLGIKKIIVLCPSCYKCFKTYYPEILGGFDLEVTHFIEVIAGELKKGKRISGNGREFILHEPCKMTRFMGILNEPREVLNASEIKFAEFEQHKNMSFCCGAGNGVRAYDMELSLEIARFVLDKAMEKDVITMCPFCSMNLGHASRKYNKEIKVSYISEVIFPIRKGG